MNNKKFHILLFSVVCTLIIFSLNKHPSKPLKKLSFNFRNLVTNEDMENRCSKTNKEFKEKYQNGYFTNINYKELDDYQILIKDVIEGEKLNFETIKSYLPRIFIYGIFLIVDVILIFVWIIYCACCCCGKNRKSSGSICGKCSFIIFLILSVSVILLCVLGYFLVPCFTKSIYGVVCSLYKLVFHFLEGTKEDYGNEINWQGVEGIDHLLDKFDLINRISKFDCDDGDSLCSSYKNFFEDFKKERDDNNGLIEKLKNAKKEIDSASGVFKSLKSSQLSSIETYIEDYKKYFKCSLFYLFLAIFLFSFLCLLFLIIYFACNCECISCLFHVFWNIEMIIIIATMLVGILFGIFGVVSKDGVSILKYATSWDNLNNSNPFILKDINDADMINQCFNGGKGVLVTFEGSYKNEMNYSEFIEQYYKLQNSEEYKDKNKIDIMEAYDELYSGIKAMVELNSNLNSKEINKIFDCNYVKYDFNILLDEIKSSVAKLSCLLSLIIIVADLAAAISILFGIIVINNYKGENIRHGVQTTVNQNKSKSRETNNINDSSSDNLRNKV
jgi:hypothetical protein